MAYIMTLQTFQAQKKEYLKFKVDELETIIMFKNIRDLYWDIKNFKKGYQPTPNKVREEKVDLVTDCHSIPARWRNHFSVITCTWS